MGLLVVKDFCLPFMSDLGSSLSSVTRNVFDNIKELGLHYVVETTEERCQTANGGSCAVMQAVVHAVKVHSSSWKVRFLVFEQCPIPSILWVDFFFNFA